MRILRLLIIVVAGLALPGATTRATPPPPTVVVVMVDDMPALDGRLFDLMPATKALRQAAVTFSDFHSSSPLCCPARTSYLTGRWTHHHHQVNNSAIKWDTSISLATALHGIGYSTFLVGKYMNGYGGCHGVKCAPHIPPGWDRWAAFGKPDYYNYDLYVGNAGADATRVHYGTTAADYSTDVVASRAVDMIRSAPPGPLFAWVAPFGIHSPTAPAPRYATATCSPPRWKPPDWNELDVSDKPAYVQARPLLNGSRGKDISRECRSLLAVDDLVAAVHQALQETGRTDAMLIFAGDNGMNSGEHRLPAKAAPYETEVPLFINWSALTATTIRERLQDIDLAPTLCELAGCTLGPFADGLMPDGVSFAPLLLGGAPPDRRDVLEEMLVPQGVVPAWEAITTTRFSPLGRWHYIEDGTGERELYDLSNGPCWLWTVGSAGDPCELQNRAGDPALATLQAQLAARLAELKR
jgi:N-acetylglucosamine-6-sulfatase